MSVIPMISATTSRAVQSSLPPIMFQALTAITTLSSGNKLDLIGKSAESSQSVIFFQHAQLSHCAQ